MCEQKPYPVWFSCRRKTYPVECEHSLKQLLLLREGEYDACEESFYFNYLKYDEFFTLRLLTFYFLCTFFDSIYARIVCEITN